MHFSSAFLVMLLVIVFMYLFIFLRWANLPELNYYQL